MSNLFLRALRREAVETPPIWMMRQAGRYHSHYQALRKKHSFMDLCLVPELAAETAMGPVQEFDFDAAILFSDLLFPLKALGQGLEYTDEGPRLSYRLQAEHLGDMRPLNDALAELQFQKHALRLTRERLPSSKGLIGFVGGPWTLFVYAVEGTHSGSLTRAKNSPELWRGFAQRMTELLIENIRLQFAGGADVVMVLDTAAGELSPLQFQGWLQPELEKMANAFPGKLGYYSKGTTSAHFQPSWFSLPWGGQGYDHRWDMASTLRHARGFTQGNFDQILLHGEPSELNATLRAYFEPLQRLSPEERRGWVCGVGHGLVPHTPEKNVHKFVETVRSVFR